MVTKEKVLERKLSRIEALLNAIEITMIVELPVGYVVALMKKLDVGVLTGLVVLYLGLVLAYSIFRKRYRKLFEEWSHDPPMKRRKIELDEHDLLVILIGPLTILIMLIVWLL